MRIKHWFYTVPLRLRSLFRRAQVEQELDEELQYHLERQIEENLAKGMTAEEARYAALRAMGGVEHEIAPGNYLLTYTLFLDAARGPRRATVWRRSAGAWKIVWRQGTIVEDD